MGLRVVIYFMATITRETIAPLTEKLIVNLAKEDYYPSFEKSLKEYAKKANIPGFRKGMVPAGLVKKMYGSSVFAEEIFRTVEKELNQYVSEENLPILGQPLPADNNTPVPDMNQPGDYAFAFEVGLRPDININPQDIHVTRYRINVTEQMIDDEISHLQTRNGKMAYPDSVESEENILNVELTEADENGNAVEEGISKDLPLIVKYFAPELRSELMGKKAEDRFTIQLSKAFEDKERAFVMDDLALNKDNNSDADKYFVMTIKRVGMNEKSDLNADFFNAIYPGRNIETEQEFRDAVKADIENVYARQSSRQVHDQIYHYLTDHTQVDFPEAFLKRLLQMNSEKENVTEDVEAEYPNYTKQLAWSLIASKLINDYNISVSPEEIKNAAKAQILSYMGAHNFGDTSWLEDYANGKMKDKKFVDQTYSQIQTDKMFTALEGQVQATEEPISVEDFAAKLNHHHH